jgi:hypothetical protein
MEEGAALGKEAVLAASGRAGEVVAGVGRVRSLDFLSILQGFFARGSDILEAYLVSVGRTMGIGFRVSRLRKIEPCLWAVRRRFLSDGAAS